MNRFHAGVRAMFDVIRHTKAQASISDGFRSTIRHVLRRKPRMGFSTAARERACVYVQFRKFISRAFMAHFASTLVILLDFNSSRVFRSHHVPRSEKPQTTYTFSLGASRSRCKMDVGENIAENRKGH